MKVDMRLELKDVPGSLLRVLEPISLHGGNIISVLHSRGEKDLVVVEIGYTIRDHESLNLIKKDLGKHKVRLSEMLVEGKQYYSKKSLSIILVGHVIDKDIQDTVDRINKVGLVSAMDVVMPAPEEKSSVMINIDVDNGKLERLNNIIKDICKEKKFLVIRSL
jgi:ACT domain-containing protein